MGLEGQLMGLVLMPGKQVWWVGFGWVLWSGWWSVWVAVGGLVGGVRLESNK